jgi:hypothetical protein
MTRVVWREKGDRSALLRSDALSRVDAVYTDVWASMGRVEAAERRRIFAPYQVNAALMAAADPNAILMHCLPPIAAKVVRRHRSQRRSCSIRRRIGSTRRRHCCRCWSDRQGGRQQDRPTVNSLREALARALR